MVMILPGNFRGLAAQPDSLAIQKARVDSTRQWRRHYRHAPLGERLVALPGMLLSLPPVLLLKAAEQVAGYVYAENLIPRTRDLLTSADGRRAVWPSYSNQHGGGFTFSQKQILSPNDVFSLKLTGNLGKRQRYRLDWEQIQPGGSPFVLNFMFRYRFLPAESFFGLGPDSRKSDELNFDYEQTLGQAGLGYRISPVVSVFGQGAFTHSNIYPGSDEAPPITLVFNRQTLPGLQSRVRIFQYGGGVRIDSRNRPGNATRGQTALLFAALYRDVDGGRFRFWKTGADLAHYIHLGRRRVLRLRLAGEITRPLANGDRIPFFYLAELGERETIRGFDRGRFRDRDNFIAALEYRIPFWHHLDWFWLIDAGQVAPDIVTDLSIRKLQFSFGAGMRFFNDDGGAVVGQFAVSKDRLRVYLHME